MELFERISIKYKTTTPCIPDLSISIYLSVYFKSIYYPNNCNWIYLPVWRMTIQIAEFPHGSVSPSSGHVGFGVLFHFKVVGRKFSSVSHITHNVEKPITHTSGEISHFTCLTFLELNFPVFMFVQLRL